MIPRFAKAGLLIMTVVMLSAFSVERFVEGTHYKRSPSPESVAGPTVVELFSYACPHCKSLEPSFKAWMKEKPQDVKVQREAASWNPYFRALAQLYYTLDTMGLSEQYNDRIFQAIHEERKMLRTLPEQLTFIVELGIDPEKFRAVYEGPDVAKRMDVSREIFKRHEIGGVPAIVVNGTYLTDVGLAGGQRDVFEVIDFLIKRK